MLQPMSITICFGTYLAQRTSARGYQPWSVGNTIVEVSGYGTLRMVSPTRQDVIDNKQAILC